MYFFCWLEYFYVLLFEISKNMDLIPFASGRQSSLNLLLFSKFLFLLFAKYYRRSWKTSLFSFFQIFNLVWCMPLSLAKGHSKSTSLAEVGGGYPKGWHLLLLYGLKTISLLSFCVTWGEGSKNWHFASDILFELARVFRLQNVRWKIKKGARVSLKNRNKTHRACGSRPCNAKLIINFIAPNLI